MTRTLLPSMLLTVCAMTAAQAETKPRLDTKLGPMGEATIHETFDEPLSDVFRGVKGEWVVADGVLKGRELAADQHAAVLNIQKPNRNSVVQLRFKFEGTTSGIQFSLNHSKGHLFRVVVSPSHLQINLDKDKKDPASKAVMLGRAAAKFAPGTWYTLQVEMKDDQVVAQTDNGAIVEASHAKLDTEKPNYRLVMRGDSLMIDDLHVWEIQ